MEGVENYVLGLDLGVASVGWAIIARDEVDRPVGIADAGVRIFPEGLAELEKGRGESRNLARRDARQRRKQLDRRARRRASVFRMLLRAGLLPAEPRPDASQEGDATHRHAVITTLYARLAEQLAEARAEPIDSIATRLPYLLRAEALTRPLLAEELGLVLYHVGSRRGFQSNRKEQKKEDKERGIVKESIDKLQASLGATHRTLGAYLASLDPRAQRLRSRYTARDMLKGEMRAILGVQAEHHPALLTESFNHSLFQRVFHQRPLKSSAALVGHCELEPKRKRARTCLPSSQRFRILQTVNHLRVSNQGKERPLSEGERAQLLEALAKGDLTASEAKKLLNLSSRDKFRGDADGKLRLIGDRTSQRLAPLFGEAWERWTMTERDAVVLDFESIQDDGAVARRAMRHYGLSEAQALALAGVSLEDSYMRLSTVAITKLVAEMESGLAYTTAKLRVYPLADAPKAPLDRLPAVRQVLHGLTNPLVTRALTELRRVVNEILGVYGKPAMVRIELARDLKNNADDREKIHKKNRDRERERAKLATEITRVAGIANPSRQDIEKAALHRECGGVCPYTGKSIAFADLFGPSPRFDVEHILPFRRSLDDSYSNKTLCEVQENRAVKGDRAPGEAYTPERLGEILSRVEHWKDCDPHLRAAKYRRFAMSGEDVAKVLDSFTTRQLNDTRYASKEAARYLGQLFGGVTDLEGKQRIQVSAGQVTSYLRDVWDVNGLLSASGIKTREDHRHHAVDAVCVALSTRDVVNTLARGAELRATRPAETRGNKRGRLVAMDAPFPQFMDDLRRALDNILVSQRPPKALAGALHQETHYSRPRLAPGADEPVAHIRKRVDRLSASEVERIVDPKVRAAVQAALQGGAPDKVFASGKCPSLLTRHGTLIPIRSVRVVARGKTSTVGEGERARNVQLANNDHAVLLAVTDKRGRVKWEDRIVSVFEGVQRRRAGHTVIQRDWADGDFVMALRVGDLLELDEPGQPELRVLWRLRSISKGDYELQRPNDARPKGALKASKALLRITNVDSFRSRNAVRITVDALGRRIKEHGRQSH